MLTNETAPKESTEYLKLIKNTKGYNWEIKQLNLNLETLERINNQMLEKFGEKQNEQS